MSRIKVALIMPTYQDLNPQVYQSHLNALLSAERRGIQTHQIGLTRKELLGSARNRLVEEFLTTDCTHVLCLDSDVILPPFALVCMSEIPADFVTGIVFQKSPPYLPLIGVRSKKYLKGKDGKGLHDFILKWEEGSYFPVQSCGAGCMLIKRQVFEKIKSPWFEFTEKSSEDFDFCMKVIDAGFSMTCDSRVLCGHLPEPRAIFYDDFKAQGLKATMEMKFDPATGKHEVRRKEIFEITGDVR